MNKKAFKKIAKLEKFLHIDELVKKRESKKGMSIRDMIDPP